MKGKLFRQKAKYSVSNYLPYEKQSLMLEINKWKVSELVLQLARIVGVKPYPLDELMLMVAAFLYHAPEIVIDIGTHIGKSARIWSELSSTLLSSTEIHTIDLLDPSHPDYPRKNFGKYSKGFQIKQHIGDGFICARDIIVDISNRCDMTFLLFLDSDHSYENVRRELELVKLMQRGCVLVHDTFYQPGSSYNHGPYLAVQDFSEEYKFQQAIHLQTGLPGMAYLRVA